MRADQTEPTHACGQVGSGRADAGSRDPPIRRSARDWRIATNRARRRDYVQYGGCDDFLAPSRDTENMTVRFKLIALISFQLRPRVVATPAGGVFEASSVYRGVAARHPGFSFSRVAQ